MADPRSANSTRDGIAPRVATYKIDGADIVYSATETNGSAVVGRAVRLSASDTVRLSGDGEAVDGKLLKVEDDGFCSVQVGGFMTLPKGDGAVTIGSKIVGNLLGAARGYIRAAAVAGATYAQAAANESERSKGVTTDIADTANVEVLL